MTIWLLEPGGVELPMPDDSSRFRRFKKRAPRQWWTRRSFILSALPLNPAQVRVAVAVEAAVAEDTCP